MRRTLDDVAVAIKSANAGASLITFDLFFAATRDLERAASVLTRKLVAALYRVEEDEVQIYACRAFDALKVTIPRQVTTGSITERDFDGVQQHVLLLDVEL